MVGAWTEADVRTVGYLLCTAGFTLAALVAWRSHFARQRKQVMGLCCAVTALWSAALAMAQFSTASGIVASVAETARSIAWLMYFLVSLGASASFWQRLNLRNGVRERSWLVLGVLSATGFGVLIGTGFGPSALIGFWQIAVAIATLLLLENLLRNCDERNRGRVQLICLGIGLVVVYDLFFYASLLASTQIDSLFITARGYVAAAGSLLIVLAMLKGRNWRGEVTLSRTVVFHSAALTGSGFYLVTTSMAGEYLRVHSGNWGPAFEIAFLVAALVILVVLLESASVRARAMVFISKHFFRLKYDYREVWLNFIGKMADRDARENLHLRTLQAVADALDCRSGTLWALQQPTASYVPMAMMNVTEGHHPILGVEDDLPCYMLDTTWIVDVRQCEKDPAFYGGLTLPSWLTELSQLGQAWIAVPLIHNHCLEAFIVLSPPQGGRRTLGWEDFDLLKTVGAQAASYLAEERASRELVDAQKFADINRRFAFIMHDIKNVVGQMSLLRQNAERYGDNPEFQKDMIQAVGNAVDRLRGMLLQLSADPRAELDDTRARPHAVELGPMVSDVVERWKTSFPKLAIAAEVEHVHAVGTEIGIVTVLDHLIQNAVDAAGPDGNIRVAISASPSEGVIEVTDDGPGMTPQFICDHLFRPLGTTKPTGSGLGAFQALKTVREMGGRLDVDSNAGKGTTMRVILRRTTPDFLPNEDRIHAHSLS
jgi:putative PEP-CTERM system histidine kinase